MTMIPHALMFRTRQRVYPVAKPVPKTPAALPDKYRLQHLGVVDSAPDFAQIKAAWHATGMQFSLEVRGKQRPIHSDPRKPAESDGLQLWIDTRNTPGVHRANRFCQSFVAMPAGGGKGGSEPVANKTPIARARELSPEIDSQLLRVAAKRHDNGYDLHLWIPAEALHGFDPESSPVIGFFYAVRDGELGEQTSGVAREFPFATDPSLWHALELTSAE